MSEAIDLSCFDVRPRAQEGVEMPLLSPSGKPTRVVLRVRGRDSQAYHEMLEEQQRRGLARAPRRATPEELDAEWWELNATLVAGWFDAGGQPVKLQLEKDGPAFDYSALTAAALLKDHAWIREQVNRFADKRENFLPGPASS